MTIAYLNTYKPSEPSYPEDLHLHTPAEEYDLNFCLTGQPVRPIEGQGRDVRLEPYIPSLHAQQLYDAAHSHPELFQWMPVNMWTSLSDMLAWSEKWHRSNPANVLYVIYDKKAPNEGRLAGMIALINSSQADLVTELGWVLVLPTSQRTHVLTHTCSLLFDLCFELPSNGGYGMRRVEWRANSLNVPSVNAALRLGFTNETPGPRGGIKAHRLLCPGKPGSLPGRPGDAGYIASEGDKENSKGNWSRSTTLLGLTYDEWFEGGLKERLKGMLVRK